jgi:hypothetical protein
MYQSLQESGGVQLIPDLRVPFGIFRSELLQDSSTSSSTNICGASRLSVEGYEIDQGVPGGVVQS